MKINCGFSVVNYLLFIKLQMQIMSISIKLHNKFKFDKSTLIFV